ncbi:hypothetical protein HFK83_03100 [Ralstonia pseudosolanacearum]|uniref:hypothetical protein n=1 Tax=Ralstonia pseudosolanacearum TaxID=1310165 RepID=UPI000372338D|nr:hypothetical protein [Ralstonia pseudosolanacearum]MCK4121358.1 hypothetical protein [Ralstonia pseudosolanacearum]
MNTKHTPGPFFVTPKFEVGPISKEDDQTNGMVVPIADVYGENCEHDARLFSAAPELLEALQAICDEQDERQGYASYETYDKARAAIAKATGASHVSQQ